MLGLFGYLALLGVFPFVLLLPAAVPFIAVSQFVRWLRA